MPLDTEQQQEMAELIQTNRPICPHIILVHY
jgi:hypothetical protein